MDAERFDYLINGYFDGQLSPAERDELDALVISDSRTERPIGSLPSRMPICVFGANNRLHR